MIKFIVPGLLAIPLLCVGQPVTRWSAKIALEDGTPLPTTPLIMIERSGVGDCRILQTFGSGVVIYSAWAYQGLDATDACMVQIRLQGYRTMRTVLRDGATVVLKRVGESEGSVTSIASVRAPAAAKKSYEKGATALRKGKWAEAQQSFEEAVNAYPDYDQAWSDLGDALEHQSKLDEARKAYEKALAISPKYLKPYAQLAGLEIKQSRYDEALALTDKAIAMNPLEFPSIYYYNAVAHFQLHHLKEAELSARRALSVDYDHQTPRALYVLGMILEAKGDRAGAIEQMRIYVKLSPKPPDFAEVKEHLSRLEKAQ